MTSPVRPPARLFTNWGTVLHVDPASGELRHGPIEKSPVNAVFVIDSASSEEVHRGWLMHDTGAALLPIVCLGEHSWTAASGELGENAAPPTLFELIPLERGILALRSGGHFLCAQPDARITLSRSHCSIWECFLASEDWCTPPGGSGARRDGQQLRDNIEWRQIAAWIPEPLHRAQSRLTAATKILIWGHTQWSHGRVYYDVSKALTERGYVVDLLDWTVGQGWKMERLLSYYDFCIAALNGIGTLIDNYHVPAQRVIGLSHHERDIRMLIDEKGVGIFDQLAGYGVVGYQLYDASAIYGICRSPLVVQLGVNNAEFGAEVPQRLVTVGYASAYSHVTPEGVEMKRGELAETATREAGLEFKIAGSVGGEVSFHDMPGFYRSVDAILVSSLTEGAQLPIREAAAAGRLVISTPVGDFPLRAAQGMGVIAPIEAHKFKKFVVEALEFYKNNPQAFIERCRQAKDAARKLDWQCVIDDWVELIETAEK
jgi:hypothetical protein